MPDKKDDEEKKSIFDKIGDAFSDRDEKAAAQKAAEEAEAARKKADDLKLAGIKADLAKQKAEADAKKQVAAQAAARQKAADEAAAKKLADETAARKNAEAAALHKQTEEAAARLRAQQQAKAHVTPPPPAMERKENFGAKPAEMPAPALAKYTIKAGDTLSAIAQKHYGHSTRDYWMVIYEANKAVIGDNPGMIKTGVELTIPELPANLKG